MHLNKKVFRAALKYKIVKKEAMKNLLYQKIVKILLLILICSPVLFSQLSFIKYKGDIYAVATSYVGFSIKEDYYNDELLEQLNKPPYTIDWRGSRSVVLFISGDIRDINVLDHYLKFEKEKFVDNVVLMQPGEIGISPPYKGFDIKGQILQNGKPLVNHIVNLEPDADLVSQGIYNAFTYNSITDEEGNYIFLKRETSVPYFWPMGLYTISFKVGDTRYSTGFILDEDKVINFNNGTVVAINEPKDIPTTYSLLQNYPNPFNPTTTIEYSIPKDEFVKLTVYDVMGRVVKELVNGYKNAGKYNIEFNAATYSSGTYYYKLEAGKYKSIQKMMLVK